LPLKPQRFISQGKLHTLPENSAFDLAALGVDVVPDDISEAELQRRLAQSAPPPDDITDLELLGFGECLLAGHTPPPGRHERGRALSEQPRAMPRLRVLIDGSFYDSDGFGGLTLKYARWRPGETPWVPGLQQPEPAAEQPKRHPALAPKAEMRDAEMRAAYARGDTPERLGGWGPFADMIAARCGTTARERGFDADYLRHRARKLGLR
jgi:hypothetical protein